MRSERCLLLVLGILLLALPARALDPVSASLLTDAEAAYERGDFAAAAAAYEQAVQGGLDHAQVHYNLGNAHFKQGELGRAIASYVRGHRLAPRDVRIATNLQRARAQLEDRELVAGQVPPVLRPVPWLYGRLSLDEWWGLALAAFVLLVAVRIARDWTRLDRRLLGRASLVLGGLVVVCASMGAARYRNEVMHESAVAVVDEIEVRSGPGPDYSLAFRIHEGLQVRLAEHRAAWVRIELGGDLTGWIPVSTIERL